MKIKTEHYEYIRAAMMSCSGTPTLYAYTSNGLTEKRWRWDWFWRAGLSRYVADNVYSYANDEHIDTALRKITGGAS